MPKTNDGGGATYAGYEGIVEHAGGAGSTRIGGISELNPEKDVAGELLEGEHPDYNDDGTVKEDANEPVHVEGTGDSVQPPEVREDQRTDEQKSADSKAGAGTEDESDDDSDKRSDDTSKGVASSPGSNSSTSAVKAKPYSTKSATPRR